MIVSIVLFLASLGGIAVSMSSTALSDLILIAGPCCVASIVILFVEMWKWAARQAASRARSIVIDGSNVMYWQDGTPRIECVKEVVCHLTDLGFRPKVIFDANAGYLFSGKHCDDRAMSKFLRLPVVNIMVVPKGKPADPFILVAAREMGADIVTNDRFRDWVKDFPEVHEAGHLIKGKYRRGEVWLDLTVDEAGQQAA
ncbi:Zc3h12a-like Ribonuclease NYN domain-containing protein [Sulfitobacter marinus]|uniref:Zc3h12a-like Ribonuclease NYN domain-containing protein n=1 Tax=Sulfitobacter marinus TaxID=394264 RepID=A0A1I6TIX7_9RHOB|nr:hypothetical protein [Sulfitobacter marinus]SFS88967.1 Zc3h12a-like Ribonuclease NYN domain-containing protein [Sulfitobacter marinus]